MKQSRIAASSRALRVLLVLVALSPLWIVLRPGPSVADHPFTEDAFYACSVARNVALGNGVTIDGEVLTNGFQPLFTFLSVPVFMLAGGDRWLAVRLMLLLGWAIYLATAYVIGRIALRNMPEPGADRATVGLIAPLLYLSSAFVFLQHFNGLETGFLLLMYGVVWHHYLVAGVGDTGKQVTLGVLLGLLVLTRIDAVFFVIVFVGLMSLTGPHDSFRRRFEGPGIVAAVSLVVSSPWWLFNLLSFGSLMPTSGSAQQRWGFVGERVAEGWSSLVQVSLPQVPFLYAEGIARPLARVAELVAVIGVIALTLRYRAALRADASRIWSEERGRRSIVFGASLTLSVALLGLWYVTSSPATYFYDRYLAPLVLVPAVAFGAAASHGYLKRPGQVTALLFCIALPLTASSVVRHFGLVFDGSPHLKEQLPLVTAHVPHDSPVAAFQSGTLGYFRDRVVNLDGKVNSVALAHQGDMAGYLESIDVDWLCDWNLSKRSWVTRDWEFVDRNGSFELYRRRDPTRGMLPVRRTTPPASSPKAAPGSPAPRGPGRPRS